MNVSMKRERNSKGQFEVSHGKRHHPLYGKWCSMKARCYNPACKSYKNYGEKGIKLCDEWLYFQNFYQWSIDNGWQKGLTIDRIDNSKDYSPDNCRYVTQKVQNRNYSRNHLLTINGETHCIKEWSEIKNIDYRKLQMRIKRNVPTDELFEERDRRYKKNG